MSADLRYYATSETEPPRPLHAPDIGKLPALIEQCRAVAAAPTKWLGDQLKVLAALTWQPDRPMDQQMVVALAYAEHLSEWPHAVLAEALKACQRECRFFPRLPDIIERCQAIDAPRQRAITRLSTLQWHAERQPKPKPSTPLSAEQRAQVEEIMAGYRRMVSPERKGAA